MRTFLIRVAAFSALVALTLLLQPGATAAQTAYDTQQAQWRKEQEQDLTKTNGWLSLAGLYWLKEGGNSVGGAKDSDLVFPGSGVPPRIGVIQFHEGVAWFTAQPGVPVADSLADCATIKSIQLRADDTPLPTKLQLGTLSWTMIKRGERYGIRLRDSASPRLTAFTGMKWYPAQLSFRITARFSPYPEPRTVPITNVVGDVYQMKAPGLLTFKIDGQEYTLEPVLEEEKLFIIFRDLTSGKTTYGAGRFLYADAPKDGKVILDFNQAVNPPCAFTPFATCPLPPARNWLKVAIPAGELKYHDDKAETAERR